MKSIEEVMAYYQESIYPTVQELEANRKVMVKKLKMLIALCIGVTLLIMGLIHYLFGLNLFVIILFTILALFAYGIGYIYIAGDYTDSFKDKVLAKIITYLDPNLSFEKKQKFPSQEYLTSNLFAKNYNGYKGNDLITGTIDKTNIAFSDLYVYHITKDSKGHTSESRIFQGIYFMADFNKHFEGELYVVPDIAQSKFGLVGTMMQKMYKRYGDLMELDNPTFEKAFAVYGSDPIMARYILTHSMMERILEFKAQVDVDIYLSFIEGKIYIAIYYGFDQFEPNAYRSLDDLETIKKYVEVLISVIGISEQLKLNDRLWSK